MNVHHDAQLEQTDLWIYVERNLRKLMRLQLVNLTD